MSRTRNVGEPKSEWARYAYGYSDKKPTFIGTWLPMLVLIGAAILKLWWVSYVANS